MLLRFALGREGATVIGTATTQEGADKITQAFKEAGIQGIGQVLNVFNKIQLMQH